MEAKNKDQNPPESEQPREEANNSNTNNTGSNGYKPFGGKTCKECEHGLDVTKGCMSYSRRKVTKDMVITPDTPACDFFEEPILYGAAKNMMGHYKDNMQLAEEFQKHIPVWYDRAKNYWIWNPIHLCYELRDSIDILHAIQIVTNEYVVDKKMAGELQLSLQITGRGRNVKDVPHTWIHTKSGIIDLNIQNHIRVPTPEYFLRNPIPHYIGKSNDTPTIDNMFTAWVGEDKIKLYEILAYCLLDDYPIHRMFLLFGSGRNGKSQFLELASRFIGRNNTTSTELEKIMDSRFEASKLYRKKLALIGETNFAAIKSSDRIKKITGHDLITAEYKGKDPFDFQNTAKILIATNSIPETLDKTEAFHSRCIIIEFKNRFDEGKPIVDTIPESEYENLLKKCLGMLPKILDAGRFTREGTIEEKAKKYEELSDIWGTYFNKNLDTSDVNAYTPLWILYEDYLTYCSKNGVRKDSKNEVARKLRNAGHDVDRKDVRGKTTFMVEGIKITQITQITQNPTDSIYENPSKKSVIPVIPVISKELEDARLSQFGVSP